MRARLPILLLSVAVCVLAAGAASAEMWRYTDDAGVTNFTDSLERVPPAYRDEAREITGALEARGSVIVPGLNDHSDGLAPGETLPSYGEAPPEDYDEFAGFEGEEPELDEILELMREQGFGGKEAAAVVGLGLGAIVAFMIFCLPIVVSINALYLMLACKIVLPETPGFGRAFWIGVVQMGASIATGIFTGICSAIIGLTTPDILDSPLVSLASFALSVGINASLFSRMLGISMGRALLLMFTQLVLIFASVLLPAIAIPFLLMG